MGSGVDVKNEVQDSHEDKGAMANAPVGRLMLKIGIPMILSMMLQAVYNIVDSAFVLQFQRWESRD